MANNLEGMLVYIYGAAVTEKGIEKHDECMMNDN
jgi:hypothetical protein